MNTNRFRTQPADQRPEPTAEAVRAAIGRALRLESRGYTVQRNPVVPEVWYVVAPHTGGTYFNVVNTVTDTCDCDQDRATGACEHKKMVHDEITLALGEAQEEEKERWAGF